MAKEKKQQQNALTVSSTMPDFLRENMQSRRGSENVKAEDLVIPRLEIIQSLSPARNERDANYITGAKEGMLYNNVTRELYGESVNVLPVFFKKEFLLWKSRDSGGGFRGAFPTPEAAEQARVALEDADDIEAMDTAQQFCLLIRPDGSVEEIAVSMSRSKMKVSRNWNSLIRLSGGDSFSRVYKLSTVPEKNAKNQEYYNLQVKIVGWPNQDLYERAEKLYTQVAGGAVTVSRAQEEGEGGTPKGDEY